MKKILFLLSISIFLIGCVTVDYTGKKGHGYSNIVKIFWEKPDFEYRVLGRIQATGEFAKESMVFDKIIEKAREVGAKAIIVMNTAKDDVYVPMNESFVYIDTTHIWALAIWYDDKQKD